MACNTEAESDDRFLSKQEHRNVAREWNKTLQKLNPRRDYSSVNIEHLNDAEISAIVDRFGERIGPLFHDETVDSEFGVWTCPHQMIHAGPNAHCDQCEVLQAGAPGGADVPMQHHFSGYIRLPHEAYENAASRSDDEWKAANQNVDTFNIQYKPAKIDKFRFRPCPEGGLHAHPQDFWEPCNLGNFDAQTSFEQREREKYLSLQKKLAKGRTNAKFKSPLQKFDEIVTRELNLRLVEENKDPEGIEIPCLPFSRGTFNYTKISVEGRVSTVALHEMEMNVKDVDPGEPEDVGLLDAIDKLAQAQAFCRFDALVKAAEEATASVPPEKAEEAAMACAKDYQADIVDIINEKILLAEEKKPVEVIGYIGVTKLKD